MKNASMDTFSFPEDQKYHFPIFSLLQLYHFTAPTLNRCILTVLQGPRSLRARGGGGLQPPPPNIFVPEKKSLTGFSRNEVLTHITPPPPPPPTPTPFFSSLLNFLQVIGKTEGIPVVLAFNTLTRIKLKLKYGATWYSRSCYYQKGGVVKLSMKPG